MDLIIQPDIEAALRVWLQDELGSEVYVGTALPPGRESPALSVLVFKSGGVEATLVSGRSLLTIESRAWTEDFAQPLGARAVGLIQMACREGLVLSGITLYNSQGGDLGSLPDPITEQNRYTATIQIHHSSIIEAR